MLRLAADENFHGSIVRGLLRREPNVDIVRVQDAGLLGADDPTVLDWAAREGRILLTHDIATLPDYAYDRIAAGQPMPGVIAVNDTLPHGRVIDDIVLLIKCSSQGEWKDQMLYLPL